MKNIIIMVSFLLSVSAYASKYNVYVNADFTYNKESGESIYKGINLAFKDVDYKINGHEFEIIKCDHRGINSRSDRCIKKFINDQNAFVMYGGLHSPPLISNLKKNSPKVGINVNKVLTLVPWAAAGIITRMGRPNWVYRLSVDDKYAGEYLVSQLIKRGEKKVALLLVNDGWGQFNKKKMTEALKKYGVAPTTTIMFDRDINVERSKIHLRDIVDSGARSVLLVANAPQGTNIIKAIGELNYYKRLKFMSHWGITGGNIFSDVGKKLSMMDLQVIQTKFSFMSREKGAYGNKVLQKLIANYDDVSSAKDIKAPVGFIHAYDLTKVVLSCVKRINLTGKPVVDRIALKSKLENVDWKVKGLVKDYIRPFQSLSKSPDGHDALGIKDFRMFKYDKDGSLVPAT